MAERIEAAYAHQLRGTLSTWFTGLRRALPKIRVGGGALPASAEVNLAGAEAPLRERLGLPVRIHRRDATRTLVVFDEFSEVLAAAGKIDAVIRSEIQHHGPAASYICSGSAVGMMRELFANRKRAFYGQAGAVELPRLPPEAVAEFIVNRFSTSGKSPGQALDLLIDAADGHPQRTMMHAHALWDHTPAAGTPDESTFADAYSAALAAARDELWAIWNRMPVGERRVLAAVARQDAPLYSTVSSTGGSRGGAVRHALDSLIASGEIVARNDQPTGHRVVDPLLAEWVRSGTPGG